MNHRLNGGKGSYRNEWVNVQVGTKKLMSLRKAIMRLKQLAENARVAVKQNTIDSKKGCCLQW